MKATGIVRRIDDLGRIVIPKEIRRQFGIQEGDPLEIFTMQEGEKPMIVFAPYQAPLPDVLRLKSEDYKKIIGSLEMLEENVNTLSPNDMIDHLRILSGELRSLLPEEE